MDLFETPEYKRITVCSMAVGEEYQKVVAPSYPNKLAYCQKHKHRLLYTNKRYDESRPVPWSKILFILEVMKDKDVEWIFWTDADSLIMNSEIRVEDFIDDRYDLILASDAAAINTGEFLIRNCKWSKRFLNRIYWHTEFIFHDWWEQGAMMHQLQHSGSDRKHVKILPQRAMNSYPPEYFKSKEMTYEKGDFIIHFGGKRGDRLVNLMQEYSSILNSNS